jgi:predicted  nucleic acid-binding Zn-ribbon protein
MSKKLNIDFNKMEKEISAIEKVICKISDKLDKHMYDVIKKSDDYEDPAYRLFEETAFLCEEAERLRRLCYFVTKSMSGDAIQ